MAPGTHTHLSVNLLVWCVVCLLALMSVVIAWEIKTPSSTPLRSVKRSAIDLALTQVYRICDEGRDGLLTQQELHCARRVLRILLTNR